MSKEETLEQKNKRLMARLALVVVGMFVFAVGIMPPLYNIFCEVTGLNGKVALEPADYIEETANTNSSAADGEAAVAQRTVKVSFVAHIDQGIPWSFKPIVRSMRVVPGDKIETSFLAKNMSGRDWIGQAVPSISPAQGTGYFKKIECFCFTQQTLAAGEGSEMPLIFYLEKDVPESITEITLAYTLYPAKQEKDQTASLQ